MDLNRTALTAARKMDGWIPDRPFTRWLLRGRGFASRLTTRKCRGCDDPSPHSAHLTRIGWWATR